MQRRAGRSARSAQREITPHRCGDHFSSRHEGRATQSTAQREYFSTIRAAAVEKCFIQRQAGVLCSDNGIPCGAERVFRQYRGTCATQVQATGTNRNNMLYSVKTDMCTGTFQHSTAQTLDDAPSGCGAHGFACVALPVGNRLESGNQRKSERGVFHSGVVGSPHGAKDAATTFYFAEEVFLAAPCGTFRTIAQRGYSSTIRAAAVEKCFIQRQAGVLCSDNGIPCGAERVFRQYRGTCATQVQATGTNRNNMLYSVKTDMCTGTFQHSTAQTLDDAPPGCGAHGFACTAGGEPT